MVAIALRLAAMKINIALEINIYSSSSTDRGEGTSDFKTVRVLPIWLAILKSYFTI